jgi:hypothetical protein
MSIRFNLRATGLFLLISAGTLCGQTGKKAGGAGFLQQHYIDAQEMQRAGKLSEAGEQYRAFLADELDELAMGYGLPHDGARAGPLF